MEENMILWGKIRKYREKYQSIVILRLFYNIAVKCLKNGFTVLRFSDFTILRIYNFTILRIYIFLTLSLSSLPLSLSPIL